MKITICGSITFYDKRLEMKKQLEQLNHQVKLPPEENANLSSVKEYYARRKNETNKDNWIWDKKEKAMKLHFQKVEWGNAVIILNYNKNNISNYIGTNTLLEMGLAFHLNKKIFLLNNIPEISYKEEILGMKPVILN